MISHGAISAFVNVMISHGAITTFVNVMIYTEQSLPLFIS
jgi:hypothetical protein